MKTFISLCLLNMVRLKRQKIAGKSQLFQKHWENEYFFTQEGKLYLLNLQEMCCGDERVIVYEDTL